MPRWSVLLLLLAGCSSSSSTPRPSAACAPGSSVACSCPAGVTGARICPETADGYGPCECPGGTSDAGTDAGGSPADAGSDPEAAAVDAGGGWSCKVFNSGASTQTCECGLDAGWPLSVCPSEPCCYMGSPNGVPFCACYEQAGACSAIADSGATLVQSCPP